MTQPIHVFLAEDNSADVCLVHEALKHHKLAYQLHVTSDCEQATRFLDKLGSGGDAPCPNVALLDLNLPKGSGHELLKAVRSHPLCAHIPVVIVTSSDAPVDRKRATELGASRYFRKPPDLDEFMALGGIVKELVEQSDNSKQQ